MMHATQPITFRVRFKLDPHAQFEECNGESRPLTEDEYVENSYMGCPRHPRSTKDGDATSKAEPGRGVCACGRLYEPIPYAEYLAYYGNPAMHTYLLCIVESSCGCCGAFHVAASLHGIDMMADDPTWLDPTWRLDTWLTPADALALPRYLGEVAKDVLTEGGYK